MPSSTIVPNIHNNWSDVRERQAGQGNYLLTLPDLAQWYAFFAPHPGQPHNEVLGDIFRGAATATVNLKSAWRRALPGTDWMGFLVPVDELDRLAVNTLGQQADGLSLFKEKFGWEVYLRAVLSADERRKSADPEMVVPRALSALWYFILHYADLLNLANREGRGIGHIIRSLPEGEDFGKQLPMEQAVRLLLLLCLRPYAKFWDGEAFEEKLSTAHPDVRQYITTHRPTLERALELGRGKTARPAELGFYRLYAINLPTVLVQELIDDASGVGLITSTSVHYVMRFGTHTGKKLGDRIKAFAEKVAAQAALLINASDAPASAPLYALPFEPLNVGTGWHELESFDADQLLEAYRQAVGQDIPEVVTQRLNNYLCRLANQLLMPILTWESGDGEAVPAWKLPSPEIIKRARKAYADEEKRAERELAELEYLLVKLRAVKSLSALTRFQENARHFQSPIAVRRLRDALARHRREIGNQQSYRNQRMREFGIADVDENEHRKQLWLDEMLRIEEEVRPFLGYVRKAFSSALPVGTTVEFDPYRHSHDGVEFDPDTLQDTDKWLRGDVMKTLRGRKNFAPIAQVNTFCLDYSRSMTHELMRDLFKVVFTLVMGLEGRKSYDAIHFFGSDFCEVVGYEDGQTTTNRSILFRVLRQVAEIYGSRIVYSGMGGTNISAGVDKSHAKMKAFSEKLREEQPELKFVSSLFVLTDGQPTMGVINLAELHDFVEAKRRDGDVEIKGIYLKHPDDKSDFISQIFGRKHSVDSSAFAGTVRTFVEVMGRTYKVQRQDFRAAEKRRKLLGEPTAE